MAKPKKPKKTKKAGSYKLIFLPPAEKSSTAQEDDEEMSGMFLEKEDIRLIYNALNKYKPTKEEYVLHSMLLESFEEILVVDYGEPYPDAN